MLIKYAEALCDKKVLLREGGGLKNVVPIYILSNKSKYEKKRERDVYGLVKETKKEEAA